MMMEYQRISLPGMNPYSVNSHVMLILCRMKQKEMYQIALYLGAGNTTTIQCTYIIIYVVWSGKSAV